MNHTLIAVAVLVSAATPSWAQVGAVNPNVPVTITVPPPVGAPPGTPPTTRPSVPFSGDPNQLNNPHPMLINAGISGTGGWGVPVRHIYMPPQSVPIVVYRPYKEATGEQWDAEYAELPAYVVTETTLGYLYPERWALYSLAKGVYRWQRMPSVFQPK